MAGGGRAGGCRGGAEKALKGRGRGRGREEAKRRVLGCAWPLSKTAWQTLMLAVTNSLMNIEAFDYADVGSHCEDEETCSRFDATASCSRWCNLAQAGGHAPLA